MKMNSSESFEKPLLSMQYETGKVLWRLFIPNIMVLIIILPVVHEKFNYDMEYHIKDYYVLIVFILLAIGVMFITIEMLLVKEIRLYEDHIEKEWSIFGTKSLEYTNTRLRGITSWIASNKGFLYINKPNWYTYKCCGYDEHLISKKNKEKAREILSKISNRDKSEFKKSRIEISSLVKK